MTKQSPYLGRQMRLPRAFRVCARNDTGLRMGCFGIKKPRSFAAAGRGSLLEDVERGFGARHVLGRVEEDEEQAGQPDVAQC